MLACFFSAPCLFRVICYVPTFCAASRRWAQAAVSSGPGWRRGALRRRHARAAEASEAAGAAASDAAGGRSRQGRTKRWTPRRRRRSRAPSASASAAEAEAEAEGGAATTTTRRGGGMRLRLVPMSASCCTYSTFLKVYFRVPPAGRLPFDFQNFIVRYFFTPGWRGRKLCGTLCAPAAAWPCPVRSRPRMDAVRTRSSSTCPIRISIPSPAREMSEQWR